MTPNAPLTPNTLYTVTIAGVKDIAGNALAKTVTSTFTTGAAYDTISPTVISVTPANGTTSVPDLPTIVVVFSEAMDLLSYHGPNFDLLDANNNLVPATVTFSSDLTTWTLKPAATLNSGATYTLWVSWTGGSLTDITGNNLGGSYYSFTTQ